MSTKLYTFNVPVTIYAVKTVYVQAEDEQEAREKFRDTDWYDSTTDAGDEEYEWNYATLDEIQSMDGEG